MTVLLGVLVLAAGVAPLLRRETQTVVASILLTTILLGLLASTFRTGHWFWMRVSDLITTAFKLFFEAIVRPFELLRPADRGDVEELPNGTPANRGGFWRGVWPVLLGLVLALPVVAILAALLVSADPVFGDRFANLLNIFDLDKLPQYIFRGFYILVLAFGFTGVLLQAILPKKLGERPDPGQAFMRPFLGFTETSIVLGSVIGLFAFFVIIQFQYLFGGQANITTAGYTYSEYARRGFGELVWVAIISLGLYLSLNTVARREKRGQTGAFSGMAVMLVGLVLIILASAWQRLMLYEQVYGFTRLRTYTMVFIPWLALLLLAAIVLELARRPGRFGLAFLVFLVGFGLSFAVLNVDAFIVRQNVQRAVNGEELDSAYLNSLSTDAVPQVLAFYRQSDLPVEIHDFLGAQLACRAALLAASEGETPLPWQSYNIGQARARRLLTTQAQEWRQYQVLKTEGQFQVMVNDTWNSCLGGDWMERGESSIGIR
jgi:hypothetical protein